MTHRRLPPAIGASLGLVLALAAGVSAQEQHGSTGTAIAGAAFGAASGTVLGVMGSIPPCWQTPAGIHCVRVGVGSGAAIGIVAGAVIGASNGDELGAMATTAAIGAGAGIVVGLALTPIAQRFTWRDVIAVGAMGAAIGSAPLGAGIGFAAGGAVGAVLWKTVDEFTVPDAVGAGIVGMSLGALTEWIVRAASSGSAGAAQAAPQLVLPIRVSF